MSGAHQPTVEDAIALAARAHRGQRYSSPEREPYVFHLLRLMLSFSTLVEQMTAILYDVIEDTVITMDDRVEASYPGPVVAAIDCLTHRDNETYEQYIQRVARDDVARRVKIADLTENLANNIERIERYQWALERLESPT